jgi:DNA-binding MarR family transcriptional regulator
MSEPIHDAPEAPAPGAPSTSLLFDVFALNQAVGRLLAAAMRDGPLTPNEYAVYSAVFELESATPTQLAGRLGMRLTTFMDQLRMLEGRGHARRVDHPTDRRSYRVVLTSAGLTAHREANVRFERAFAAISSHLPDGEPAAKAGLDVVRQAAAAALIDLASPAERPTPLQPAGRAG